MQTDGLHLIEPDILEQYKNLAADYASHELNVEHGTGQDAVLLNGYSETLINLLKEHFESYGFKVKKRSFKKESFGFELTIHSLNIEGALKENGLSIFRDGLEQFHASLSAPPEEADRFQVAEKLRNQRNTPIKGDETPSEKPGITRIA